MKTCQFEPCFLIDYFLIKYNEYVVTSTRFFYKHCNILAQAQMLLSKKKVFKMLFGMSKIILKWSLRGHAKSTSLA